MQINSRIHRWFGTANSSRSDSSFTLGAQASGAVASHDLELIRNAMLQAVMPCSELHRLRATDQIRHARSVIELWLMRADIFQYLAQDIGQMAAAQQIGELMPLFKDLVPAAAVRPSHAARASCINPAFE